MAGVALAWAGTTLGMEDIVTDESHTAKVSIVRTNLTVYSTDGRSMLTEAVPETIDIEVVDIEGTITITAHGNAA
jgi:hypothetical protein